MIPLWSAGYIDGLNKGGGVESDATIGPVEKDLSHNELVMMMIQAFLQDR